MAGNWEQLISSYFEGKYPEVLQALFTQPCPPFSRSKNLKPGVRCFLNYVHALCFGSFEDQLLANRHFHKEIKFAYQATLDWELLLIEVIHARGREAVELEEELKSRPTIDLLLLTLADLQISHELDPKLRDAISDHYFGLPTESCQWLIDYHAACWQLARERPGFSDLLKTKPSLFPVKYTESIPELPDLESSPSFVPTLFLEPFDVDWKRLLAPLKGRPALFIFLDSSTFWHHCQFPALLDSILDPAHHSFILDCPIAQQLEGVSEDIQQFAALTPTIVSTSPEVRRKHARIADLLANCIRQRGSPLAIAAAEALYDTGLKLKREHLSQRLGPAHKLILGLHEVQKQMALAYPDPERDNYIQNILESFPKGKRGKPQKTRRIAHVIPQLVDGGHAPSKLIYTLLKQHDKERFEIFLYVTECYADRNTEYPPLSGTSGPSRSRAPATLKALEQMGIHIWVDKQERSLAELCQNLVSQLDKDAIDAVFFHEGDIVNLAVARQCSVPTTLFYQHARHLHFTGFDHWITADPPTQDEILFCENVGTKIHILPVPIDRDRELLDQALPHTAFGLPMGSILLMTVSNHLESRCSPAFISAVADILKKYPTAYYLPIGDLSSAENFSNRFEAHGVTHQVRPLGQQPHPSQLLQSATLYLNEFPLGSGFGIVDAMAAGIPVVSMSAENSPIGGRGGGIHFGEERCVGTGDLNDYVELACRLLKEPAMLKDWKNYTKLRYLEITDKEKAVKAYEAILCGGEIKALNP